MTLNIDLSNNRALVTGVSSGYLLEAIFFEK
jgi:hypothetical protein